MKYQRTRTENKFMTIEPATSQIYRSANCATETIAESMVAHSVYIMVVMPMSRRV